MDNFLQYAGWFVGALAVIGGFLASVGTFRKTKPEATGLLVDAASDVVVIQKGVIDELRKTQQSLIDRLDACEAELTGLHAENLRLRAENNALKRRVKELEART